MATKRKPNNLTYTPGQSGGVGDTEEVVVIFSKQGERDSVEEGGTSNRLHVFAGQTQCLEIFS